MKFNCQDFCAVSSRQFHTSRLLLDVGLALGLGQCEHIARVCSISNFKNIFKVDPEGVAVRGTTMEVAASRLNSSVVRRVLT